MDAPAPSVAAHLEALGIPAPADPPLALHVDGKDILVFHGHERGFRQAVKQKRADYIVHGHTHQQRNERIGRTRVINPGALSRANPKTVATLDTATDEVNFHMIQE
jgi:predicted phosphodiesterase